MAKKTVDAIPTMTSNTSPSGVASADTVLNTSYDAWKAFDKTNSTTYQSSSGTKTGWLCYEFEEDKRIWKYTIKPFTTWVTMCPVDWKFEAFVDGKWVELDNRVGVTDWKANTKNEFECNTVVKAKKYRINVSKNNGSTQWGIGELEMFEEVLEKKLALKNTATNKYYSLEDKTLIHLPDTSNKNMILHGIEQGTEIQLDVDFDKIQYVSEKGVSNTTENALLSKPLSISFN